MTPRRGVRAALTEERSKAEIKTSALRRGDEKSPLTRTTQSLENTTFSRLFSYFCVLFHFYIDKYEKTCYNTSVSSKLKNGGEYDHAKL